MIGSSLHPRTTALHRHHARRYWHALGLMAVVVIITLLLTAFGYFGPVTWIALAKAVGHTAYRLAIAYGIAILLGVSIALLVGWSPFSDYLFPIFDVLQNLPSFALIPLFIYFLGYTNLMIILFAVSSIIWPILFAVLTAIKSAHNDLNDAATIFGATGFRRIAFYLAPLSFPAMLTGSIIGIAIGWESVIGAEIITSAAGFGAFIKESSSTGLNNATIAGMVGILVIVFIINRLVWAPLLAESSKRYAE